MSRRRGVTVALAVALAVYGIWAGVVVALHRQYIYPYALAAAVPQGQAALAGFTARKLPGTGGLAPPVTIYMNDAPAGAPVVVYFMGNAGAIWLFAPMLEHHAGAGRQVVAMGYPGGGGLPGVSSETILKADALAVVDALPGLGLTGPVFLQGYSLGTGLAVHVAAERAVEGVILSAPYARLCSLFTRRLGVPACHLPRFERWASVERAPDVAEPVLILHGSADAVVPLSQGLTLAQALPNAQTVIIEGANHLDLVDYSEYLTAIDRFIAARQH